jgi:hypothetical protein
MRTALSTVLGLALIIGLFVAGGASSPATIEDSTAPAAIGPVPLDLPFSTGIGQAPPPPPATVRLLPRVPDPSAGQPLNEWFGCRPPDAGTVCPALRATGPETLIPRDPAGAEDWRPLVAAFFMPEDVDRAIRVIQCESKGDPWAKNPRSTASGLFQHLRSMWPPRAADAGYAGADVFDPVANVATAAWLVYEGGGWSHWYPSRPCWR